MAQLIRATRSLGLRVSVAAPSGDLLGELGPACEASYEFEFASLRRTTDVRRVGRMAISWIAGTARLGKIIKDSGASIVYANSGVAALACCGTTNLLRVPLVWHQHDIVPDRLVNRAVLSPCGYASSRVLAVSTAVSSSLERLGLPRGRIEVLHNSVRSEFFERGPDRDHARSVLGLPLDRTVVAMAGRLVPYKGHVVFLDAVGILRSKGVDVDGVIAGGRPQLEGKLADPFPGYIDRLASRADQADVAGHVFFVGRQRDVRGILAAADVLVVPSFDEPFPLIVLEGLAFGVPVVASDSGGHPEAVKAGETGLLFKTGDATSLASCLERVLLDSRLREGLRKRGREDAAERFSEAGLGPRLQQVYGSVCPIRAVGS